VVTSSPAPQEPEEAAPKPLPLAGVLSSLEAAWKLGSPVTRAAAATPYAQALALVLQTPGLPWTAWAAAAGASTSLVTPPVKLGAVPVRSGLGVQPEGEGEGSEGATGALAGAVGVSLTIVLPVLRGLAFAMTHSTVAQVRAERG